MRAVDRLSADGTSVRWARADTVALALVTVGAALLRLIRLSTPGRIIFDEIFYAQDACVFVRGGGGVCSVASPTTDEHPHLAKWLIAAGIELFGYDPFGWRVAPAVFGTLGVALLYVLARRLLGSMPAALAASGLLALDTLWFVQSRVAMLDIFVSTFAIAALLFVVLDHARPLTASLEPRETIRDRPWLVAAGLAAGAAVASKWSGIWFWVLVAVLPFVWDVARRRDDAHPVRNVLRATWRLRLVALGLLPALLYVVSFGNRFSGGLLVVPWRRDSWWWDVAQRQWEILIYHLNFVDTPLPWTSPAWSWPLVKRPIVYGFEVSDGRYSEILAMGNPLVWIPAAIAVVWLAVRWVRPRNRTFADGVILAGSVAAYVPWLVLDQRRSSVFLFYLLPAVPFMMLALVRAGQQIVAAGRAGRMLAGAFLAVAIASFAFFYPVVAWVPLERDAWEARIWFRGCSEELRRGEPPDPSFAPAPPPDGWCWT